MREIKFRAITDRNATIVFTLDALLNPTPLFSIRELLLPWLRAGNKPDTFTGIKNKNGKEIYENDLVLTPGGQILTIKIDFLAEGDPKFRAIGLQNCEIIGNIYESIV